MTKKKTITLIVVFLVIALLAYTVLNRGRQLLGYLSYNLKNVKVHKIGILSSTLKVSLSIDNPSNAAASVEALKVELYYVDQANNGRRFLAASNVITLNLPAHGSIGKEFNVDVSNVSLVNLFGKAIINGSQSVLSGKIAVLVKATIAGQYAEKEMIFQ